MRNFIKLLENMVSPNIFKQAVLSAIKEIDWGGGDGETVLVMLGYDTSVFSKKINPNSKAVKKKLYDFMYDRVEDAFYTIERKFSDGKLRIYRAITAPKDWTPEGQHPGIFWSWDIDAADTHWGNYSSGHVTWIMTAEVTSFEIDWVSTLRANASTSMEDEREITIFPESNIHLLNYKILK